jgi:allantoicase
MSESRISFTDLVDLASEKVGAQVLSTNDDFFAPKENLIKASVPVFIVDKYTDVGKWMDGWESRRKRGPGHDWCTLRLGLPGVIRGVDVDTAHFTGNYPEYASLEASTDGESWKEILPKVLLQGGSHNLFPISDTGRWTHLRLNIFPDGGVARLRVYGHVKPDWEKVKAAGGLVDLASVELGGRALACSDQFYSHPGNLILRERAKTMGEGWETRRRRGAGSDWVILRLGTPGKIRKVEVDTNHYKGNFPESCTLEACQLGASKDLLPCDFRDRTDIAWITILTRTALKADHRHLYEKELKESEAVFDHIRLQIHPDGGISRLRIFGEPV